MNPSLYVNGQDLEALGLHVETCTGPWDLPAITDPAIVIPNRLGRARTGAARTMAQREIALGGTIIESAGVRTNADFEAKTETIKAILAYGILDVRFVNQPTRSYLATPTKFTVTPDGPALAAVSGTFALSFVCEDPLSYELVPDCVAFAGSPVPVPLATGPVGGVIRIMGPATNPVVTYRGITGMALHTLGFTRTLAADDYLEIDLDAWSITRYQSGAASNDAGAMSSGDIEAFSLLPADGDRANGVWPTLECSGLGAGGGCEHFYTRTHL